MKSGPGVCVSVCCGQVHGGHLTAAASPSQLLSTHAGPGLAVSLLPLYPCHDCWTDVHTNLTRMCVCVDIYALSLFSPTQGSWRKPDPNSQLLYFEDLQQAGGSVSSLSSFFCWPCGTKSTLCFALHVSSQTVLGLLRLDYWWTTGSKEFLKTHFTLSGSWLSCE